MAQIISDDPIPPPQKKGRKKRQRKIFTYEAERKSQPRAQCQHCSKVKNKSSRALMVTYWHLFPQKVLKKTRDAQMQYAALS